MDRKKQIANNLLKIQEDILSLKIKENVDLVAVTKYGDYTDVDFMYQLGHRDFGENRVDELLRKNLVALEKNHTDIRWHFLGQIQSNKINDLLSVKNLVCIHSISDFSHFQKINDRLKLLGNRSLDFYLQINTSLEEKKSGLESFAEITSFIADYQKVETPAFKLIGLMTMGKIRTEHPQEEARICFEKLSSFCDQLNLPLKLSMGMSGDYKIALKSGADCLRIGSILFK